MRTSGSMSRSKQRKELIDKLLSTSATVLSLTDGPLTLAPIPGLPVATSALLKLVEMVQETRANSVECLQLASSLQDLVECLNLTSEKIQKQLDVDSESINGEYQAITMALQRSQSLSDRVKQLSSNVNDILREGQKLSRGNAIQRFLRSSEDAVTLKSLNDQVLEAKSRFQLQGTISIEMVVNEIIKSVQLAELERNLGSIKTVDAGHRAPVNGRKSKWLEGTRTELLEDIEKWSMGGMNDDTRANSRIFVLVGAAGTGKSTIAVQVAKILDNAGALGGSFFFERGVEELSATRYVFPTLAVQLARSHPTLAPFIVDGILRHRKNGNTQHLSYALDELIVEPLKLVPEDHWPLRPVVFVLDALDECNEQSHVPEMLYLMLKRIRSLPFPLRLFITTRPEYHIQDAFASVEWRSEPEPFQLHSIPTAILHSDIKRFIDYRLSEIGLIEDIKVIKHDAVDLLTDVAGGLFIYASTCIEFINQYKRNLRQTLGLILDQPLNVDTLDALYKIVLENAFSENTMRHPGLGPSIPAVLGALPVLQDQLTPNSLSALLGLLNSTLDEVLERLRSVLTFGPNQPIRLLHASFPQYLGNPARCQLPRISDNPSFRGHDHLAAQCLKALLHGNNLKNNVCDLEDPFIGRNAILDLHERLTTSLPSHVQYACLHWSFHLSGSVQSSGIAELLMRFMETKMMNWLEALAMMGRIEEAVVAFNHVLKWYKKEDRTRTLLHDGHRFILTFMDCIQACPFQVYTSALVFIPSKCLLREMYPLQEDYHPAADVLAGLDETWGPCLRVIEGSGFNVTCVAFSQDGSWIASASTDHNIYIWDANSGALLRTLCGHTDWVSGCGIASEHSLITASLDGTVRIWNATTGAPTSIIEIMKPVQRISVSPISKAYPQRIAVDIEPHHIQILDLNGQILTQYSEGHSLDLRWSADARYLAVVRETKIIIYDTTTFSIWKELEDKVLIQTVTFFPQPQLNLVVSGGIDSNLRLWKISAQECLHTFQGHTSKVKSVTVNPSCTIIASGSYDATVRLWSVQGRICVAVFTESCYCPHSLAFSPNGRTLVSVDGRQLRSWDVDRFPSLPHEYTAAEHLQKRRGTRISCDHQFVATEPIEGGRVEIWGLHDDRPLATQIPIKCENKDNKDLALGGVSGSPDGTWIATTWWGYAADTDPLAKVCISLVNTITQEISLLHDSDIKFEEDLEPGTAGVDSNSDVGMKTLSRSQFVVADTTTVSPDGQHIYLQHLNLPDEQHQYVLHWETKEFKRVDVGTWPLAHAQWINMQTCYDLDSFGWLADRGTKSRIAWIPSAYRGQSKFWTIHRDDYGEQLLFLHVNGVMVLDLKTKQGGGHQEDSKMHWQNPYRCVKRAFFGSTTL
ncbi:hypothetical protein ONZ45_g832 [Pleurotus djamor]|nr:hypothetical protein ONZ45_g832 [Pleurotus djamor]